jgi:hypothetical protein
VEVDGAAFVGDDDDVQPEPGDLAICLYCAEVAIYALAEDQTLCLRRATLEERLLLSDDEDIMAVRQKIFDMLGAGSE